MFSGIVLEMHSDSPSAATDASSSCQHGYDWTPAALEYMGLFNNSNFLLAKIVLSWKFRKYFNKIIG